MFSQHYSIVHLEELAAFVQDGDGARLAGIDAQDSQARSLSAAGLETPTAR
jgi:hypothetical protein